MDRNIIDCTTANELEERVFEKEKSKKRWLRLKKEILQTIKLIDDNMLIEEIEPHTDAPEWWLEMMGVYDDLTKRGGIR